MIIAFEKQTIAENGAAVSFHVVQRAEMAPDGDAITMYVASWPTQQSMALGVDAVALAAHRVSLDTLPTCSGLLADLSAAITASGWLAGAAVVNNNDSSLAAAKTRRWAFIKAARDQKEYGGFVWDGSTFDSDLQAQTRIQGGVQLANMAAASNQPFGIDWTLADNSVRTLSGADMVAVGLALAQHVQTLHEVGRGLREQIDAATTVEQVNAVQWPA